MLLQEQLTARYRIVAQRYREALGLEPPVVPSGLEELAATIREMVATINGYMEANAGPIASLGDISFEITHDGDVIATVEGRDEHGKRARYTRFSLHRTDLIDGTVTLLRDAAGAEARRAWKVTMAS